MPEIHPELWTTVTEANQGEFNRLVNEVTGDLRVSFKMKNFQVQGKYSVTSEDLYH